MSRKNKFYSLTPTILDQNSKVYDDALDEALNNKIIKNIAITGIYGAGKSTVWETYKENNKLEKVINVSLGKHETKRDTNQSLEEFENSIERQLINQIIAQVKDDTIPLSKYKFKRNKPKEKIAYEVALVILFIIGVLFFCFSQGTSSQIQNAFHSYYSNDLNNSQASFENLQNIELFVQFGYKLLIFIAIFSPLSYAFWYIFKNSRPFFSKLKVGNAEANFEEEINSDETVLDRDIRELVYVLYNSKTNIVVFEDLDRYDHIELYRKLRELNFLVNSYLRINSSTDKVIKFIYLVKDGLFNSKERTKFFDFIIPIVPIINSRNSEYKLLEMLEDEEARPDKDFIFKISLYIDDYRLLKNIVNEYTVYFEILPIKELTLNKNKLFTMVVIKNILPNEFDKLQRDRGYIYNLIMKIDKARNDLIDQIKSEIKEEKEKIQTIQGLANLTRFEILTNTIPAGISLYQGGSKLWKDIIRDWEETPSELKTLRNSSGSTFHADYEKFIETYSKSSPQQEKQLELMQGNAKKSIQTIKDAIQKLNFDMDTVTSMRSDQILQKINQSDRNKFFEDEEAKHIDEDALFLIKFLILEGYLDESYRYYKGYMNVDTRGVLDTLFMKNILEGNQQDIYLKIENPDKILSRLSLDDFNRLNILNVTLLVYLVENSHKQELFKIFDSVSRYDTHDELVSIILHCYKTKEDKNFFNSLLKIVFPTYKDVIYILVEKIQHVETVFFESTMGFLYYNFSDYKGMSQFNTLVVDSPNILNIIDWHDESKLLNLKLLELEFDNLSTHKLNKESISLIYDYNLYTTSINNLHYIINSISESVIDYAKLLDQIFDKNSQFEKVKEKVSFEKFIPLYVNGRPTSSLFMNNEKLTIDIINSSVDSEYKIKYLTFNTTKITDISEIDQLETIIEDQLFEPIFETNTLEFTTENVDIYIDNGGTISDNFIGYLETNIRNIEFSNIKDNPVYNNVFLSNQLINDPKISDTLFSTALNSAEKKIIELNPNIKEEFVIRLAESELLTLNKYNIKLLLENSFLRSLTVLFNQPEGTIVGIFNQEPELLSELNEELIYELIQNVKNQENLLNLLTNIEFDFELSKINIKKDLIFEYVLSNQLTSENFKYVISNYDSFMYKDEFINNLNGTVHIENMDIRLEMVGFFKDYLSSNSIAIEDKAVLINRIIDLSSQPKDFIKYLEWVPEFRSLSTVFYGKHPSIESKARKIIVDRLANIGYITIRKDDRIMNKQKEI